MFFESKGTKRTLASVLAIVAAVSEFIPAAQPISKILIELAGAFGLLGVTHAALAPRFK
jgi:hypothetical protein